MKVAGAGRAVAKETDGDLAGTAQIGGESGARGDSHPATNDTISSQNAQIQIGDVHGAALALAGVLAGAAVVTRLAAPLPLALVVALALVVTLVL